MGRIIANLAIGAVLTSIVAFGADKFTGTWKLNMEKSKFSPAPPVKSLTTTREATADGVKVTSTGELADGTAINSNNTVKYDGKSYPITGAPWDTMTIKQVNENTLTSEAKKTDGKYSSTARTVVSKDGKTMTITSHGTTVDGKPSRYTMVYDKQ